jgi:nicotinamide-nucleotide amidase
MPSKAHAQSIIEKLKVRGETLAVAESLTGGGLGHALTQVPGASEVFIGGVIAYTSDVKINILGVQSATIDQRTVVSEEVALEMAQGAMEKLGATWAIATTGIAICGPICQTLHLTLDSGRDGVRQGAISSALGTFARILS